LIVEGPDALEFGVRSDRGETDTLLMRKRLNELEIDWVFRHSREKR
jgi:hypothetical protein